MRQLCVEECGDVSGGGAGLVSMFRAFVTLVMPGVGLAADLASLSGIADSNNLEVDSDGGTTVNCPDGTAPLYTNTNGNVVIGCVPVPPKG